MIMFRLTSNFGFGIAKGHSFGDKSKPSDFKEIHAGFIRVIIPTNEQNFSKFFRMYINETYEWHPRIQSELKKERSKLRAAFLKSNGREIDDYQKRNRDLQDQVYKLKDDVRALVRASEVIDTHHPKPVMNKSGSHQS
jgi:hypothetical protein